MSQTTSLLDIPPELRLMIYNYLLDDMRIEDLTSTGFVPPITRTCRLMRQESAKPYVKQLTKIAVCLRDAADLERKMVVEERGVKFLKWGMLPTLEMARKRYCRFDEKKREVVRKLWAEGIEV